MIEGRPSPPTVQLLGNINRLLTAVDFGLPGGADPAELDLPLDMMLLKDPYAVTFPFPLVVDPALLSTPASLSLLDDASATVVNVLSNPVVLIARPLCRIVRVEFTVSA